MIRNNVHIIVINLYHTPVFPLIFYTQENSDNFGFTLTLENSMGIVRLKNKATKSIGLQFLFQKDRKIIGMPFKTSKCRCTICGFQY